MGRTSPFPIGLVCCEIPVQQVRRNVELVIAVRRHLVFADRPFEIFDDLLTKTVCCLSHRPLTNGNDEPQTLSYHTQLFGPIGADVRTSYSAAPHWQALKLPSTKPASGPKSYII